MYILRDHSFTVLRINITEHIHNILITRTPLTNNNITKYISATLLEFYFVYLTLTLTIRTVYR